MARRARNYAAEYKRRLKRNLAKGLTRSQARGHPKGGEQFIAPARVAFRKLEAGVAELRKTKNLSAAARKAKVAPERLRRYLKDLQFVEKKRGRWFVGTDPRVRNVLIYTAGRRKKMAVQGYEPAALAGSYWDAVHNEFLPNNDPTYLKPFVDVEIADWRGNAHTLETRPNVLYRLANESGEPFEQVYAITA
jgi:hypothetical protein